MITTDDAVGVSTPNIPPTTDNSEKWFVGLIYSKKEKKCQEFLTEQNYETYLPIQKETRIWSRGRKREVERIVLPGYLFIRCTEERRKLLFSDKNIFAVISLYLYRFLVDRAGIKNKYGVSPVAVVSNEHMKRLQFMVGNSDDPVTIEDAPLHVGDIVRVRRGKLAGFEGELEICDDNTAKLVIRLDILGAAKVTIDRNDVVLVK